MSKAFKDLEKILEKTMALQTALALLEWDDETLAPEEAGPVSYTHLDVYKRQTIWFIKMGTTIYAPSP